MGVDRVGEGRELLQYVENACIYMRVRAIVIESWERHNRWSRKRRQCMIKTKGYEMLGGEGKIKRGNCLTVLGRPKKVELGRIRNMGKISYIYK